MFEMNSHKTLKSLKLASYCVKTPNEANTQYVTGMRSHRVMTAINSHCMPNIHLQAVLNFFFTYHKLTCYTLSVCACSCNDSLEKFNH